MSVKVTQITRQVVAATNVFRVRVQLPGLQGIPGPAGVDTVADPLDLVGRALSLMHDSSLSVVAGELSATPTLAAAEAYADGLAPNYDASGDAAAAETAAKAYADSLAPNYDAAGAASAAQAAAIAAAAADATSKSNAAAAAAEAYADGKDTAHVAASDPHGDRIYAAAQAAAAQAAAITSAEGYADGLIAAEVTRANGAYDAAGAAAAVAAGLGTAAGKNVPATGDASSTQVVMGNDSRLSDGRTPTSTLAHAASHGAAGSDPVTVTEAQVTGLVTDLAAKAPTARTISTSGVLSGGGDLSANRTLSLVFGSGLTNSAGTLIVDSTVVPLLASANVFTTTQQITIPSAATRGLIIKAAAAQSTNLQEWQNSAGAVLSRIGSDGSVVAPNAYIGTTSAYIEAGASSGSRITGNGPTVIPWQVRGSASQRADLQTYQLSTGVVVGGRNAAAQIYTGTAAPLLQSSGGATTAASGDGTTATITTTSAHGLTVGDLAVVAGITPTGYNGTYVVTAVTSTTISYLNATTGSQTVAGTVGTPAQLSVQARSTATAGLIVRMAGGSGTGPRPVQVQNSGGTNIAYIDNYGGVYCATFGPINQTGGYANLTNSQPVTITTSSTTITPLVVKGVASITADLQQWQDSAGSVMVRVTPGGYFGMLNATAPASNLTGGGYLYVEGGALKYRGSSGTVTTIAVA